MINSTGPIEPSDPDMTWTLATIAELDARAMHDLLRLRCEVFVVEQACPYQDIDGLDTLPDTRHLIGRHGAQVVACARSLVSGEQSDAPARLGRIVVARQWRGRRLACALVQRLLADLAERHPQRDVILGAQLPAMALYASFGFRPESREYLEDGIPHVDMRLTRRPASAE